MAALPEPTLTVAPTVPAPQTCFHCGLPVPAGAAFAVTIDGASRPMCCKGCEAVAQAIVDSGLTEYYRFRTDPAATAKTVVPDFLRQLPVYDHPEVQKSFVRTAGGSVREAALILEGITCAACVWLNERHLSRLPGVLAVNINYATHRAQVRWDNDRIRLSDILRAVLDIGYRAHPYDPAHAQELLENERKQQLRRLAVAGALGMQVMILAVALYAGAFTGIEAEYRKFFHWVSLFLTLPVLTYSAQPFFKAAWRDLKLKRAGMDTPVSLGISIAFLGSMWATFTGIGDVYFDSVVMFVFFLLAGRYFELVARKHATQASEALVHLVPATATRVLPEGEEVVPVAELRQGDEVLIRPGERVPADGRILKGRSSVDESLLTGESMPVSKAARDAVIGGSVNMESPLHVRVEQVGQETVLAGILRLLERAQTEKPRISQLADRAAGWLVSFVLLLTAVVAWYWWHAGSAYWLPIAVSMLVITCPCALSLATPTAITAATGTLMRRGLLVTRAHALEGLARATHFVFDKTGTLTYGRPRVLSMEALASRTEAECLALAAALEGQSEHPIARAMLAAAEGLQPHKASGVVNVPGAGLSGEIAGEEYVIGTPAFVAERTSLAVDGALLDRLHATGQTIVLLADQRKALAAYVIGDEIREGARAVIDDLKAAGKQVLLFTGDHEQAARRVATAVGIDTCLHGLKPADKLARVQALQAQGATVAMLGDGVNDAASLAAAHVSIAIGNGTELAIASADIILLSDQLTNLQHAMRIARKTMKIIRQNIGRAIVYNLIALPIAALGYVAPWAAAIGMSASSLIVVANAMRLIERRHGN